MIMSAKIAIKRSRTLKGESTVEKTLAAVLIIEECAMSFPMAENREIMSPPVRRPQRPRQLFQLLPVLYTTGTNSAPSSTTVG